MKKGFTIMEILIAMMVLFVAIAFVNISIKAFNTYQRKSQSYQNLYITALSLKDWISTKPFDQKEYAGNLNAIEYTITIKELIHKKNYYFDSEEPSKSGNYGDFLVTLYSLKMILSDGNLVHKYDFFITKEKSLNPLPLKGIVK